MVGSVDGGGGDRHWKEEQGEMMTVKHVESSFYGSLNLGEDRDDVCVCFCTD